MTGSIWMQRHEELSQGIAGLLGHVWFGMVAIFAPWVIGKGNWAVVGWAGCGLLVLAMAWEVAGHFASGRTWKASLLGMLTYPVGAFIAGLILALAGGGT